MKEQQAMPFDDVSVFTFRLAAAKTSAEHERERKINKESSRMRFNCNSWWDYACWSFIIYSIPFLLSGLFWEKTRTRRTKMETRWKSRAHSGESCRRGFVYQWCFSFSFIVRTFVEVLSKFQTTRYNVSSLPNASNLPQIAFNFSLLSGRFNLIRNGSAWGLWGFSRIS